MATQTTNRIAVDVTPDMIAKVNDAITTINDALPFLIGLTTDERRDLPKINVVNKVFVGDALLAAKMNPHIIPAYLRITDMAQDKTGYDLLDEPALLVSQLAQKLIDTQMLMGSEAFVTALTIYRLFESAARDGVPGADAVYRQLAERFKGQGNSNSGNAPTPPAAGE